MAPVLSVNSEKQLDVQGLRAGLQELAHTLQEPPVGPGQPDEGFEVPLFSMSVLGLSSSTPARRAPEPAPTPKSVESSAPEGYAATSDFARLDAVTGACVDNDESCSFRPRWEKNEFFLEMETDEGEDGPLKIQLRADGTWCLVPLD